MLVLDDDSSLRGLLALQLEVKGFKVTQAARVADALAIVRDAPPAFAVVDLHLSDGTGLQVCQALHRARRNARSVMVSGYGSLASAVAAVKLGAADYLLKPAEPGELVRALLGVAGAPPEPAETALSPDRRRWTHIQNVFEDIGRNRSKTARRLGMHRGTLQRILARGAPD